jgi:hypothetical protein
VKRGTAFTDISTVYINAVSLLVTGAGTLVYSTETNVERYNSIRIDQLVGPLDDVQNPTVPEIGFYLEHGKVIPGPGGGSVQWDAVTAEDIMGPIDDDGWPTIESAQGKDGVWKILKYLGTGTVNISQMGRRVYSVGYVGNRSFLRGGITVSAALHPTEEFLFSATCTRMFVHTGKSYERYSIYGRDGGQIATEI